MSSSILSNNNCGPVTGLLSSSSNQKFLLHAQAAQKTISPPPLWRTFYAPPATTTTSLPTLTPTPPSPSSSPPLSSPQSLTISNIFIEDHCEERDSSPTQSIQIPQQQQQQQITLNLKSSKLQNNLVNLPNQRMTLQKLPTKNSSSSAEQNKIKTQGVAVVVNNNNSSSSTLQNSIMSVSKLVRPTPKSQHPHHHQHHNHQQLHHNHHPQHQPHLTLHQQQPHIQQHPHAHHHYLNDIQTGPINLVTSTNSSSEHGTTTTRSRPSSNSSVDIESDDIPMQSTTQSQQHQQQHHQQQQHSPNLAAPTAAYPFSYSHLYANKPGGYHNALHHAAAAAAAAAVTAPTYPTYAAMAAAIAASTANNNIYPINTALSHHHHAQSLALAPPPSPLTVVTSSTTATGTTIVVPSNNSPNSLEHRHQQQHHHHQHLQDQQQKLRSNNSSDHLFSPPLPAVNPPSNALANGTYLNCKSSPASDSADSSSTENYFKVPNVNVSSGKEGSLKHRILTRPAAVATVCAEKEEQIAKTAVISTHNSTANFKKGSYIELANGVLRRVEDMRTEDFIQCAERSVYLQLAESTVVRIDTTKPQMVIITFSYDRNRSKAEIEVTVDHPFFVYGQGWASCDPEKSHKAFGLKCQRLQVGDICISLTQRTTPATTPLTIKTEVSTKDDASLRYVKAEHMQQPTTTALNENGMPVMTALAIKNELQAVMPPPTAAAAVYNQRLPATHYMPYTPQPPPPPPTPHHQLPYPDFAELVAAAYNNATNAAHLHHLQSAMPPPPTPDAINGYYQQQHQQTQQLYLQGKVTAADLRIHPPIVASVTSQASSNYCPPRKLLLPPPPPPPPSSSSMGAQAQQSRLLSSSPLLTEQDQPFDASIASRKRRWSAPEGDCEGGNNTATENTRDHCQNSKLYKAAMAPVTT